MTTLGFFIISIALLIGVAYVFLDALEAFEEFNEND